MTSGHLTTTIRALEERLLDPAVRASAAELEALLADDFAEIGASGRRYDKDAIIESLANETPRTDTIVDFSVAALGAGHALARYVSVRPDGSGRTWRSSIWRLDHGAWKLTYHQGTPMIDDNRR